MAPLQLTVRLSTTDSFPLEIEDDETVEAMAVAIFSLRPELGEELRLAHKGRPLKDEWELRQASVKSGDVIAVARKPLQRPVPQAEEACSASSCRATGAPGTAVAEASAPPVPIAAQATPDTPAPASLAAVIPTVAVPAVVPMAVTAAVPKQLDGGAPTAPVPDKVSDPQEAQRAAPTQEAPAQEEQPAPATQQAPAQELAAAVATPELPEEEEEVSAEALLAMARRLEGGDADAHPSQLVRVAALLRKAATRLQVVESALGDVGQAMQMVNMVSVHALRGLNSSAGARSEAPEGAKEDGHKSYLIKKGDADVQEAHRLASLLRPSSGAGGGKPCTSGGMLSSSATPLTKEEMDRARKARVERLEAQQAEKRREQEEAAARSKAHESLFEKPFAGSAKPLGKH